MNCEAKNKPFGFPPLRENEGKKQRGAGDNLDCKEKRENDNSRSDTDTILQTKKDSDWRKVLKNDG